MSNETVDADRHAFAHERMRLDLAARADAHASLNLDERPDHYPIADVASVQIHRLMHDDVFTKDDVANTALSYRRTAHHGLSVCGVRL